MKDLGQLIEKLPAVLPLLRKTVGGCGHKRRNPDGSQSPAVGRLTIAHLERPHLAFVVAAHSADC